MDFLKNSKRFSFRLGEKDALGNVCETETVRDGDTLTTVYRFEGGLTVTNIARKHGKCAGGDVGADAYEWVNLFENTGNEPTEIISELWDCDVEIPFEKDAPKGWTAYIPDKEKVMKIYAPSGSTWTGYEFFANPDESVQGFYPYYLFPDHAHKSYSTCGGRSSNSRAPFFNIHRQGAGVIFAIGWTGQWICDIDRTETGVRIRTKIEDTHFRLLPGEKIRTSSVVIMPYNGTVTESQNMWRRLVRRDFSLIGKPGRDAEGIFCAGIWGGKSDEGVLSRINKIRENKLPFEDIWMDAGWYGTDPTPSPDEFEGRWYDHTGDWRVNAHHHPNGLEPISKAVRDAGMKYLLWVEPERVIRSTPIAKEHPEYFLTSPNAECTSLLLNLGDEEAWNYCFNTLSELIERLNLHYYRQDFNTEPLEYWRKNDSEDRVGISEIKYISGLYRLWDALLEKFPHLMIDNCSSGGRRIDIETLRRSVPLWRSDAQCPANYPCEIAQMHNMAFSAWIPYNGTGTGRGLGDTYRARSAYSGALTTNYSFSERESYCENEKEIEWLRRIGEEYLRVRPYFYGDIYPLTQISDRTDIWSAVQFDRPEKGDGIVQVFRREDAPYTDASFALHGISADKTYIFRDADADEAFEVRGEELVRNGFCVHIAEKRCAKIYFYSVK